MISSRPGGVSWRWTPSRDVRGEGTGARAICGVPFLRNSAEGGSRGFFLFGGHLASRVQCRRVLLHTSVSAVSYRALGLSLPF